MIRSELLSSVAIVLIFFPLPLDCAAQLLQSSAEPADELIERYLLVADEISAEYCVRIMGHISSVSKDAQTPVIVDFLGLTAISHRQNAKYFASGTLSLVDPNPTGHSWLEMLSIDGESYDKRATGDTPREPNGSVTLDGKRRAPNFPMIDPFGLVLCTEGALVGDRSKTANLQEQFLSYTLKKSDLLESGDTLGVWEAAGGHGLVTVLFGSKYDNYPIETRYAFYETNTKKPRFYSRTKVVWEPYANEILVPRKIEMEDVRPGGDRVENSFSFRWVPPKRWQDSKFDFKSLDVVNRSNWRESFLAFFVKSQDGKR